MGAKKKGKQKKKRNLILQEMSHISWVPGYHMQRLVIRGGPVAH